MDRTRFRPRKQTQDAPEKLVASIPAVASRDRPQQQFLRLRARRGRAGGVDINIAAGGGAAIAAVVALSILVTALVAVLYQ